MVVLDVRELSFIDGRGLHAILEAAELAHGEGGRLLVMRGLLTSTGRSRSAGWVRGS